MCGDLGLLSLRLVSSQKPRSVPSRSDVSRSSSRVQPVSDSSLSSADANRLHKDLRQYGF